MQALKERALSWKNSSLITERIVKRQSITNFLENKESVLNKFSLPIEFQKEPITIKQLMTSNCHLGHNIEKLNKRMTPFIYGSRNGIHIIDLEQTLIYLNLCQKVVSELKSCKILFISSNMIGYYLAASLNQFYSQKFIKGTFANNKFVLKQNVVPDLVICLEYNLNVLKEALRVGIPTISLVDTNNDPTIVTWPIPCNDDLMNSQLLIASAIFQACQNSDKATATATIKDDQGINERSEGASFS